MLTMHEVKLEKFSGPLDLLLQLIEQEKLPIAEVSLSQVAEQYLHHLKNTKVPPEELADFLLVAAKLLYLKSKILIPQLVDEDLEEGIGLEQQLRMYKEFVEASKQIQKIIVQKQVAFSREKIPAVQEVAFRAPPKLTGEKMLLVIQEIIESLQPLIKVPTEVLRRTISIQEKISHLKKLILQKSRLVFKNWISRAEDRTEVVVSFLALLEMVKQRHVVANQTNLFTEIIIEKL